MRTEIKEIVLEGQVTGPAKLIGYILDSISVAPDKKRPAVIICPGGGYSRKSDRESEPIAMQFLSMGCHAFIMDYSVAPSHFPTAVRELAEAVAIVREHGEQWQVDTSRIIVTGFSAGGHLACSLGVFWNQPMVYDALGREAAEVRPDGMILAYPVITGGPFRHEGSFEMLLGEEATQKDRDQVSLENFVSEKTPKAFIWHTVTDDAVPVESSLLLASAMRKHNVNFEMHIYPAGCHGLSLASEETGGTDQRLNEPQCQSWISLVKTWIANF